MSKYAKFTGTEATQYQEELSAFIRVLFDHNVQSYLEVGARRGDTFKAVMLTLPPGSKGVAIDLPNSGWGEERSDDALRNVCRELNALGYHTRAIFGSSHHDDVIEDARSSGPYDAVFIDGDHSFYGVTQDYNDYAPMADKLVALHDIAWQPDGNTEIGVPQLWQTIKSQSPGSITELVCKCSVMGIGIVHQPPKAKG